MIALRYPQGATLPSSEITLKSSSGSVVDPTEYDSVTVTVQDGGLGGTDLFEVTATTFPTYIVADWASDDLGALDPGTYGVVVKAHEGSEFRSWTGVLVVDPG